MMLTNFLPGSGSQARGNGTYKLYAIATDVEGKQTTLGSKTITVDNAHAAKPFGAIDTPGQGETIGGSAYVNFGWALTPTPAKIPVDGSSMYVFIDGSAVGNVVYNSPRPDIDSLFPGYANTGGAVGHLYLDTTTLTNGMHTIAWNVYDNQGRGDGIGSRYFHVLNAVSGAVAAPKLARIGRASAGALFRTGYETGAALRALEPIAVEELERVEIQLPEGVWTGYSRVGAELRPLPVGSLLDGQSGVFTWQLGPGFLGRHELLFRSGERTVPVEVRGAGEGRNSAGRAESEVNDRAGEAADWMSALTGVKSRTCAGFRGLPEGSYMGSGQARLGHSVSAT